MLRGGDLGIGHDNAAGVQAGVEFTAHGEAGFGGGGRDQLDNHPIADEGPGAVRYPVPQRTFKYVATVQSVTDETCQ